MNGYVQFETVEGDRVAVNADRVNFVRRYKGGDTASAINFDRGHYVVVKGSLDSVAAALAEA